MMNMDEYETVEEEGEDDTESDTEAETVAAAPKAAPPRRGRPPSKTRLKAVTKRPEGEAEPTPSGESPEEGAAKAPSPLLRDEYMRLNDALLARLK